METELTISLDGRQGPGGDVGGPAHASESEADSADNLGLPADFGLVAELRADLVKAVRRAELAEAALRKTKRKRPKRPYETPEFAKAQKRSMRAWGLRVADGDASDLGTLRDFHEPYEDAQRVGAQGLHANGTSWTAIGAAVGITRQGARQLWAGPS